MTFHKPVGEENTYVRFGYFPQTVWNHTQGQFSGSMHYDPVNVIYTSQQPKEIVLCEELEGDFK